MFNFIGDELEERLLFLQDYAEPKNNDLDYHILTIKDEH